MKMKKIVASILTFMMLFMNVPTNVFAADTAVSGSGSKSDPYIVSTTNEFYTYLVKGYIKLNNDIVVGQDMFISKESGIDLNGHILDFKDCNSSDGLYIRETTFSISDSNPTSEHDEKYSLNDGTSSTPIKGGIITGFQYDKRAGGFNSCVYVVNTDFTMTGGTFFDNNTKEGGTCIGVRNSATAKISNVNFYNNSCDYFAPCIWNTDNYSSIDVSNCNFIGNKGKYAGVIYADGKEETIDHCLVKNNQTEEGGAIKIGSGSSMLIKDTTITDNTSTKVNETAGVYFFNSSNQKLTLDGKVIIQNNTIDGKERNVYSLVPMSLKDTFSKESKVGVFHVSVISEPIVVKNIGNYQDCFINDTENGEFYIDDDSLCFKKKGHDHSLGSYHEQVDATCSKKGTKAYYSCGNNCSNKLDSNCKIIRNATIEKLPHTYTKQEKTSEYLRAKATNCQEHDTYWYVCSVCGQSAKDDSNAQDMYYSDTQVGEHQYSDKLSSDDTKHYYECTVKGCTSKKDVQKHIVSDWIIDEEATPEKEGTKHKECTVCKRILETQKISKKESGNIEKKNDENITINNDVDYLSKNILTEQEVEKVKQGENAQIYVDVKDEVNKTDLEKVNASLDTYKLGKVYDISLWLKVGENTRQVTTSKEKLGMSLKVPEELINKDSKVKRTYKVMRVHEGKVTLLDGIFDEKTQMIAFETDQFSTYALVYSDTKAETKNDSTSDNQETVKPTVKEETKATVTVENKTEAKKVKTGDDIFVGGFAFLLVSSLIGMLYLRRKESK